MTMAHSLEARSPFLDVDWIEWTARLPDRLKIRRMAGKWLLKAAFGEMLPRPFAHAVNKASACRWDCG